MMTKEMYLKKCRSASRDVKKYLGEPPIDMKNPEVDHTVPIHFGYQHGIPTETITSLENLSWKSLEDNRSKSTTLTEEAIELLGKWHKEGKINNPIGQHLIEPQAFNFSPIIDALKHESMVSYVIPTNVAITQRAVWCQRDESLRWEKTKRAMGHVFLDTHRIMIFFVYPDGHIERGDGNTRAYIWRNNYQFTDYDVPKTIFGIFIKVRDRNHAEQLYHAIDSTLTAETFAEKLSGYMRHKGLSTHLPKKWKKGESVYDILVVAVDGYIPSGESAPITLEYISNDAERALKTAEILDYVIDAFIEVGSVIARDNTPRQLTAPLIGMLIRYLLNSPNDKIHYGSRAIIEYLVQQKYTPWTRRKNVSVPEINNLFIMLDELQTTGDIAQSQNPRVEYDVSSRRILLDAPTNTTRNLQDRRLYCGWIIYCFEKFLRGEVMDEDIVFDVTGVKMNNTTTFLESDQLRLRASNILMTCYDNYWK